METSKRVIFLVAIFLVSVAAQAESTISRDGQYSPQEIARRTFPSVVMIIVNDSNGQPLSLGSGFSVQYGIIATNRHVIEGGHSGYIKLIGQEKLYSINGILSENDRYDLALLSVPDVRTPKLSLSRKDFSVGDTVYAIGNPRGLEGTFSEGIISSVRKIGDDDLIQITAPISPGSSGGPVINSENEVIGVATATIMEGQNLNFAVPVKYLDQLLKSEKKLTSLMDTKKQIPSYTSAFGKGNKSGIRCEQFLWDIDRAGTELLESGSASFSFSIRNELNVAINNLIINIIFYDPNGRPLEVFKYESPRASKYSFADELVVPPNLAKRVKGYVDFSIRKLTTKYSSMGVFKQWADKPYTKIEFRVLSFDIVQ